MFSLCSQILGAYLRIVFRSCGIRGFRAVEDGGELGEVAEERNDSVYVTNCTGKSVGLSLMPGFWAQLSLYAQRFVGLGTISLITAHQLFKLQSCSCKVCRLSDTMCNGKTADMGPKRLISFCNKYGNPLQIKVQRLSMLLRQSQSMLQSL